MSGVEIFIVFIFLNLGYVGSQMPKKSPILPITEDLPFIKCDVCQKAAKVLFKTIQSHRTKKKVNSEFQNSY